ncbi:hypothetical protein Rxycam_02115 [Rubrobacter xylanophilus DSM 9941]|nr:hypothetical protein Rxycam_02115 [Rubrobacter xylanophilus DSM 9941]
MPEGKEDLGRRSGRLSWPVGVRGRFLTLQTLLLIVAVSLVLHVREPLLFELWALCMALGGCARALGDSLCRHGMTSGELLRLVSGVSWVVGFAVFALHLWLSREYGGFVWAMVVYAACGTWLLVWAMRDRRRRTERGEGGNRGERQGA